MASVHRQTGTRFWIGHFIDGEGRRRTKSTAIVATAKTKKLAQQVADGFEGAYRSRNALKKIRKAFSSIADELNVDFKMPTVSEYLTDWLKTFGPKLAPSSRTKYASVFAAFTEYLEGKTPVRDVDGLTVQIVRGYREAMEARVSAATVNNTFSILAGVFTRATAQGLIIGNPFSVDELGGIRGGDEGERRPFTLEELKLVLTACDSEWRSMVLFGLYTTQRLSDIAALTWNQIDVNKGEIAFLTRKTKRRMAIPIAGPLAGHIASLRRGMPQGPVHPAAAAALATSGKAGTLSRRFNEILQSVNLVPRKSHKKTVEKENDRRDFNALSFHSLRHTGATWLRAVGASESVSREIVGHDSVSVDRGYVHTDPAAMRAALDKLPDVLAS
jgi:integrase